MPTSLKPRARPILRGVFAFIAITLIAAQLVAWRQWLTVETQVDLIVEDSLKSIQLLQRMGADIERKRVLLDRHIFEHEAVGMNEVEARMARFDRDFAEAAEEYEPLARYAGEAEAWHRLRADLARVDEETQAALQLSRQNRDGQAMALVTSLESGFAGIERDLDRLVRINHAEAGQQQLRVHALERHDLLLRFGLAAALLLITLFAGLWVTRTIAAREQEIRGYAVELEHRNGELDAFAGRVAHDLRGPLTKIKMTSSLLSEKAGGARAPVELLRRSVLQMERLIDDLLLLSSGALNAEGMIGATQRAAAAVEEDLRPRLCEIGGLLRVEVEPAEVKCSESMLRQVLWNLGENAVKYRRADAPLTVELCGHSNAGGYELQVNDNGAGMSPDETARAFEPFFRGRQTTPVPGTGLGLSIVRRIVEASGGTVSIVSTKGAGTAVTITLPMA